MSQAGDITSGGQGDPTGQPPGVSHAEPESLDPQMQAYRRMSPAHRVAAGCALHDFALDRLRIHLGRQHPEMSEHQMAVLIARRFLGDAARVL